MADSIYNLARALEGLPTPPRTPSPRDGEPTPRPVNGVVQPRIVPPLHRPGRLTNQLHYLLHEVVMIIRNHPCAKPFLAPVDAKALNLLDYHQVIRRPMDLGTIQLRLENNYYWTAQECIEDFHLMLANCHEYNYPSDEVVRMANTLERLFKYHMVQFPKHEVELNLLSKMADMPNSSSSDDNSSDDDWVPSDSKNNSSQQLLALPNLKDRGDAIAASNSAEKRPNSDSFLVSGNKRQRTNHGCISVKSNRDEENAEPLSFEQMKQLSVDVGKLSAEQLAQIVQIIPLTMASWEQSESAFEIDITTLESSMLRKLESYVTSCLRRNMEKKPSAVSKDLKKKPCTVSKDVKMAGKKPQTLETRLQNIRRKLYKLKQIAKH